MAEGSRSDQQGGASETQDLLRELFPDDYDPSEAAEAASTGPLAAPATASPEPPRAEEAAAEQPPAEADAGTDEGADGGTDTGSEDEGAEDEGADGEVGEVGVVADEAGVGVAAAAAATSQQPVISADDRAAGPGQSRQRLLLVAGVAVLALIVLGAVLALRDDSDQTASEPADASGQTVDDADSGDGGGQVGGAGNSTGNATDAETATATSAPSRSDDSADGGAATPANGPTLSLQLTDYTFTADGAVPSEEIKAAIDQRIGLVFAEFGTSNIVVDPTIEPAPWLEAAPSVVNAMVLLHEGSIDISPEGTVVAGRGLEQDFAGLESRLSPDLGFPPFSVGDSDVIDRPAPWVRAIATGDGTVQLTGELADETMRTSIVDGAIAIYGAENVVDETTVNPERHNRFLIMRFPSNLAAYRVFGSFDIKGENESFTAVLQDGLVFETLATDLTPESRERLTTVMFTLTRNPLPVSVVGHTDAVGSDAANLILSQQRAESVADFLVENGVDRSLITVEGLGETQPVGDNTTEEGRSRNRRVEIVVGLPTDG